MYRQTMWFTNKILRRIACFRHTHKIGLLAIIYNSFFSSFWSVCKTFFRRKSTKSFGSLSPLARYHFSQVSCFLVSIMNKTISRVLRTQSWTYCTDKQWFINNVYIEIWEESYVFNADIQKKIGSLALLARNLVYIFLQFPTRRHSIRPYMMNINEHIKWTNTRT